MAAQRALNVKVHTLVSTLRLQDQMRSTYPNVPVLKGRSNYDCLIAPVTVDQAPCQVGFRCAKIWSCPYYQDRAAVDTADYAVFNYQLYLNLKDLKDGFKNPDMLFCDEAHLLHLELEKYMATDLSERDIATEGWTRPRNLTVKGMADWASAQQASVLAQLNSARSWVFSVTGGSGGDTVKGLTSEYKRSMAKYNRYQRLARTLDLFIKAGEDSENGRPWVMDKIGGVYRLRPVLVDEHSDILFEGVDKVVLMSATINPDDVDRLGITDYKFVEVGSNYDPARRPVFYRPVGAMSSKTEESLFPDLVEDIDTIIEAHVKLGHKGIIHTVSYQRAEAIKARSKYKHRMLTHTAANKDEVIQQYKDSTEPVFLLSPSIMEGEDFPHDQCRVVIIPKVPYLSLGDKVVVTRKDIDPEWYTWKAIQDVIQGAGRGMRSEGDYCSVYILDGMFEVIARKHWDEIPQWFKDAIKYLEIGDRNE